MQPAQGPGRMPNPLDKVASSEQVAAVGELIVQQWKAQDRWATEVLAVLQSQVALLEQLVALGQANKAALDAMQAGEPGEFSVRGLADADKDSPFIGG